MSKNSNRKFVGTFALIALMSVLLVRVFSELAFASEPIPAFDAPAQILGTYEIHQIVNSDHGRMCRDKKGDLLAEAKDEDCGKKVWVIRTDDQLALLDPLTRETQSYIGSFMLYGELWHPLCESSMSLAEAKSGLFSSKFCRAFHAKKQDTRKTETFIFSDKFNVLDPVISVSLGIGTSSGFSISVPKGETLPAEIKMVKRVSGTVLFFLSGSFTNTYTLSRISD